MFGEKWRRTCPQCKKRLKYRDPVLMRHWVAAELSRNNDTMVKRNDIIALAECCDSGWVKMRGMV